jgi:hypothetical protein
VLGTVAAHTRQREGSPVAAPLRVAGFASRPRRASRGGPGDARGERASGASRGVAIPQLREQRSLLDVARIIRPQLVLGTVAAHTRQREGSIPSAATAVLPVKRRSIALTAQSVRSYARTNAGFDSLHCGQIDRDNEAFNGR